MFWVGDKAIGGKMFTLLNLDVGEGPILSFAAGHEHAAELQEREGLIPAPYFARAGWIAAERWDALTFREWQDELAAAHAYVLARLPARTLAVLAMPVRTRAALIKSRRALLIQRAGTKKTARKN